MRTKLLTMFTVLLALFSTSLKAQETTYYWYLGWDTEDWWNNLDKLTSTDNFNVTYTNEMPNTYNATNGEAYALKGTREDNYLALVIPADWPLPTLYVSGKDATYGIGSDSKSVTIDGVEYKLYSSYGTTSDPYCYINEVIYTPEHYWYVGWTQPTSLEELKTLATTADGCMSLGGAVDELGGKLLTNSSEIGPMLPPTPCYVVIPVGYDIYDATLPNDPITNSSFTKVTDVTIANHEVYVFLWNDVTVSGLEIYMDAERPKYYWYLGWDNEDWWNNLNKLTSTENFNVTYTNEMPNSYNTTDGGLYALKGACEDNYWALVIPADWPLPTLYNLTKGMKYELDPNGQLVTIDGVEYKLYSSGGTTSNPYCYINPGEPSSIEPEPEPEPTPEPETAYYWYIGVTDPRTLTPGNVGNEVLDQWTEFTTEKESPVTVSKQDYEYDDHTWYVAAPYDWKYRMYGAVGGYEDFGWWMHEAMIDGAKYTVWETKSKVWQAIGNLTIVPHVPITSLSVEQSSIRMNVDDIVPVKVIITPENTTESDSRLGWVSSNDNVVFAHVGELYACAPGTATITITDTDFYGNGASVSFEVIVEAAAVEPEAPKVESGEYYLYNVGEKKFLSRGEHWGTCATVDKYGIPFVWTAEEYSLKSLDSNVCLFETDDNNIYTDNASTGFVFEYTEGGYLLKSQKSDRYLTIVDKAHNHQIVNVTNDATAATLWQPMTKAERDAIVAGYVEENYTNVIAAAGLSATAGDFINYLATLNAEDKTSAIGTARFAGSAGGWKFTELRHQDRQPAYGTDFCELWQATGYYTQTITGLAEGIYKVTMQGYERTGGWAECNALGEKGYEITTATLSANGEEVNLKSWYSGKSGEGDPDNTGQAVAKFNEGKYMNELYTYVGEDGTLDLMVNIPSHVGGSWVLFNNFTLTHYAEGDATGIDMTTDNRQQTTVIYDLMGRKVESPAKGIYIVNGKKVVLK